VARIRSIKPEFWSNEKLSALPVEAHLLAAALLNYADDHGYFNANPALVRAACFPLRDITFQVLASLLEGLAGIDYLRLERAPDGRVYGWIVHFGDHQRVDHPSTSKIAGLVVFSKPREVLANPRELLAPDQGAGSREGSREQGAGSREHEGGSAPAAAAAPPPPVEPKKPRKAPLRRELTPEIQAVRSAISTETGAAQQPASAFDTLTRGIAAGALTVDDAAAMVQFLAHGPNDRYWFNRGIPAEYVFAPKHIRELLPLARGWKAGTLRTAGRAQAQRHVGGIAPIPADVRPRVRCALCQTDVPAGANGAPAEHACTDSDEFQERRA
jgi:hypothetical protein